MNVEARLLAMQETIDGLLYLSAEHDRRIANLIRPGTIKSYDAEKDTAVLDLDFETHDIPSGMHAGKGKDWSPPKAGQQVTAFCPSGDIANAFFLPGGFHNDNPAPSQSADEDIRAERGSGDEAVRLRTTDDDAELDNKKHKTKVRAGKDVAELDCEKHETKVRAAKEVAELDNKKGKSAVRAKKAGVVTLEVEAVEKLKIKAGDQWFAINQTALVPTSAPE
jgi:phage baseplate assembly protein gpV